MSKNFKEMYEKIERLIGSIIRKSKKEMKYILEEQKKEHLPNLCMTDYEVHKRLIDRLKEFRKKFRELIK